VHSDGKRYVTVSCERGSDDARGEDLMKPSGPAGAALADLRDIGFTRENDITASRYQWLLSDGRASCELRGVDVGWDRLLEHPGEVTRLIEGAHRRRSR
jgi:hypothetical protein